MLLSLRLILDIHWQNILWKCFMYIWAVSISVLAMLSQTYTGGAIHHPNTPHCAIHNSLAQPIVPWGPVAKQNLPKSY